MPLGTFVGWNQRVLADNGVRVLGSTIESWFPFTKAQIEAFYPGGKSEYLEKSRNWMGMALERCWILKQGVEVAFELQRKEWGAVFEKDGLKAKL